MTKREIEDANPSDYADWDLETRQLHNIMRENKRERKELTWEDFEKKYLDKP